MAETTLLKALEHRKHISISENQVKGAESWLDLFETAEDLLTASVFERLAYLSPNGLGQILCSLGQGEKLTSSWEWFSDFKFWPKWEKDTGENRIPDVYFQGQPTGGKEIVHFVVENKRENAPQKHDQWVEELISLKDSSEETSVSNVVLLAIGGVNQPLQGEEDYIKESTPWFRDIRVVGGSWHDLLKVIESQLEEFPHSVPENRILIDIKTALSLHGIRPRRWLEELPERIQEFRIESKKIAKGEVFPRNEAWEDPLPTLGWSRTIPSQVSLISLHFEGEGQ